MQEKNNLSFTVVSDPGNTLARRLGVLTQPSVDALGAQLRLGLDLTTVNADGTIGLPMPTTLIVDAEHVLRWIDVHPDYSARSEPRQILDALDYRDPDEPIYTAMTHGRHQPRRPCKSPELHC
jgi:peroxiredoxin